MPQGSMARRQAWMFFVAVAAWSVHRSCCDAEAATSSDEGSKLELEATPQAGFDSRPDSGFVESVSTKSSQPGENAQRRSGQSDAHQDAGDVPASRTGKSGKGQKRELKDATQDDRQRRQRVSGGLLPEDVDTQDGRAVEPSSTVTNAAEASDFSAVVQDDQFSHRRPEGVSAEAPDLQEGQSSGQLPPTVRGEEVSASRAVEEAAGDGATGNVQMEAADGSSGMASAISGPGSANVHGEASATAKNEWESFEPDAHGNATIELGNSNNASAAGEGQLADTEGRSDSTTVDVNATRDSQLADIEDGLTSEPDNANVDATDTANRELVDSGIGSSIELDNDSFDASAVSNGRLADTDGSASIELDSNGDVSVARDVPQTSMGNTVDASVTEAGQVADADASAISERDDASFDAADIINGQLSDLEMESATELGETGVVATAAEDVHVSDTAIQPDTAGIDATATRRGDVDSVQGSPAPEIGSTSIDTSAPRDGQVTDASAAAAIDVDTTGIDADAFKDGHFGDAAIEVDSTGNDAKAPSDGQVTDASAAAAIDVDTTSIDAGAPKDSQPGDADGSAAIEVDNATFDASAPRDGQVTDASASAAIEVDSVGLDSGAPRSSEAGNADDSAAIEVDSATFGSSVPGEGKLADAEDDAARRDSQAADIDGDADSQLDSARGDAIDKDRAVDVHSSGPSSSREADGEIDRQQAAAAVSTHATSSIDDGDVDGRGSPASHLSKVSSDAQLSVEANGSAVVATVGQWSSRLETGGHADDLDAEKGSHAANESSDPHSGGGDSVVQEVSATGDGSVLQSVPEDISASALWSRLTPDSHDARASKPNHPSGVNAQARPDDGPGASRHLDEAASSGGTEAPQEHRGGLDLLRSALGGLGAGTPANAGQDLNAGAPDAGRLTSTLANLCSGSGAAAFGQHAGLAGGAQPLATGLGSAGYTGSTDGGGIGSDLRSSLGSLGTITDGLGSPTREHVASVGSGGVAWGGVGGGTGIRSSLGSLGAIAKDVGSPSKPVESIGNTGTASGGHSLLHGARGGLGQTGAGVAGSPNGILPGALPGGTANGGAIICGDEGSKGSGYGVEGAEPSDSTVDHVSGSACCAMSTQPSPTTRRGCCQRCVGSGNCEVFVWQPSTGSCWLLHWKGARRQLTASPDRITGDRPGLSISATAAVMPAGSSLQPGASLR